MELPLTDSKIFSRRSRAFVQDLFKDGGNFKNGAVFHGRGVRAELFELAWPQQFRHGARVLIVTPHYTDHSSYCSPTHRWHLSSFSLWFFSERPREYNYYAPARFRERSVRVKLLQLWRWLGLEFLVNQFERFRRFWEYYLCFIVRGKNITWELEVIK